MINKNLKNFYLFSIFLFFCFFCSVSIKANFIKLIIGLPQMFDLLARMLRPNFHYLISVAPYMIDTFEIAIVASVLGVIISIPLSLIMSKNSSFNQYFSYVISSLFAIFRTIPVLIWAAFLVSMFSIGKFSGIMATLIIAILISTRLIVEHIDAISENKILSVKSTGANSFQILKHCILPSTLENIISVFFIVLESCLRSATVLGLVGAGGIGQILWKELNFFRYDNVACIVLVMFFSIYFMDLISIKIRNYISNKKNKIKNIKEYKNKIYLKKIFFSIIFLFLIYISSTTLKINFERFVKGLDQGKYIFINLLKPDLTYTEKLWRGLYESFSIAIFATLFGALFSLVLVRFTSYNLNSNKYISYILKAFSNILRTFPAMITAIIFFRAVGPGAFAGALALTLYTCGNITKLFSEHIEAMNENLINSIKSTGATTSQIYIKAIIPESWPVFLSLVLYRMESNIRNSTILGMVGAGGIGVALNMNIQWRNWNKVGLLLIGASTMIIVFDSLSRKIRKNLK